MCETSDVPPEVAAYMIAVANAEFKDCEAFFPTPRGNLRGTISVVDGKARLAVEGSEEAVAYAAQCAPHVTMVIKTELRLPDGSNVKLARYARYPGDREGDPRGPELG